MPAWQQVRAVLNQAGLLYIGDSKMEALPTRAAMTSAGDYYLTPLSLKGHQEALLAELLIPVWQKKQDLTDVYGLADDPEPPPLLAQGYEPRRPQGAVIKDQWVEWEERVLVVYSPSLAKQAQHGLAERLDHAAWSW